VGSPIPAAELVRLVASTADHDELRTTLETESVCVGVDRFGARHGHVGEIDLAPVLPLVRRGCSVVPEIGFRLLTACERDCPPTLLT